MTIRSLVPEEGPGRRVRTGNASLDAALGDGIPAGFLLLVEGEPGAGASAFALTMVRAVGRTGRGRFASALRSPARIIREAEDLLAEPLRELDAVHLRELSPMDALAGLGEGDVLVLESAAAIADLPHAPAPAPFARRLGDAAASRGVVILLLYTPGTLRPTVETALAEAADGVLRFGWRDGGPIRRRVLWIPKLRGLAPGVEGESIPVYELSLQRGSGILVSRIKNVV